ncbi:MAG TPA: serine/threonine-protein kinase [Gemmatales bacterium]|nr:serine/threonine-protein kinase [Gemmatales bacterium]
MAATTSDLNFLELVRKSGLLSDEVVGKFERDYPQTLGDPALISATMLKQGLLTSFQSKVLLSGKHLGFILGPYKIMDLIGKGGMGRIFLAEHTTLHRRVAIKTLQSEKAKNQELLQRFYREARAVAALDHPNIVKIFDVNEESGTHFLVMEYVSGRTLKQIIASKGPLSYQKAVRYIIKTATGLKHAHEKGFVHRDIKPDNIIVSTEGNIKILDMGLARSLNEDADNLTKMMNPNAVYGSVDYISPEQSIGGTVDARSDLYSLGATLFALITGTPPFSGTAAQILAAHQLTKVPDLTRLVPSVPAQLNAIVAKLMAKQPEKRYRSASEVIDALLPWSQTEQGSQSQITAPPVRREPERVRVEPVLEKPSVNPVRTQTSKPKKKKPKKPQFSVSPKVALAIVGAGFGLAIIIISLYLITGRPRNQETLSAANLPVQPAPQPLGPLVDYVSKNPRKDVITSNCVCLDMSKVANVISTKHIFIQEETETSTNTIPLLSWGRSTYHGVPFELIDPKGKNVPNILIFGGGDTAFTKDRPASVIVPCNTEAKTIHVLGGISGWAYPHIQTRNVILVVQIYYKDGHTEKHDLYNGVQFADWKMPHGQVPTAPVVAQLDRERHLRYFSIEPKSREEIAEIKFIKGENQSAAPIFFAITVEKP